MAALVMAALDILADWTYWRRISLLEYQAALRQEAAVFDDRPTGYAGMRPVHKIHGRLTFALEWRRTHGTLAGLLQQASILWEWAEAFVPEAPVPPRYIPPTSEELYGPPWPVNLPGADIDAWNRVHHDAWRVDAVPRARERLAQEIPAYQAALRALADSLDAAIADPDSLERDVFA